MLKVTILIYGTAKCVDMPPTAGAQECIPPLLPLCYITDRKHIRLTLYTGVSVVNYIVGNDVM